jgi:glutamate synthase (ferredoxin)
MDEMVGRVDRLEMRNAIEHWKAGGVDLSQVLHAPDVPEDAVRRRVNPQDHGLQQGLDTQIIAQASEAIERKQPVDLFFPIRNVNRTVGTRLGFEITRRHGAQGLPDNTIRLRFAGSAGQSFGAFVPSGVTLTLEGDANDFVGKGLSGARLIVHPPAASRFAPEENIIVGNVALYGATGGEAYFRGIAGERFAVRNSGARAVVEGVGDHGCEYMTAGRVLVLGRTGRNFAAGMSGGVAYVMNTDGMFERRCNPGMVDLEPLEEDEDISTVLEMLRDHVRYTGSTLGSELLADWTPARFVKVIPRDYKRVLLAQARAAAERRAAADGVLVVANG